MIAQACLAMLLTLDMCYGDRLTQIHTQASGWLGFLSPDARTVVTHGKGDAAAVLATG